MRAAGCHRSAKLHIFSVPHWSIFLSKIWYHRIAYDYYKLGQLQQAGSQDAELSFSLHYTITTDRQTDKRHVCSI